MNNNLPLTYQNPNLGPVASRLLAAYEKQQKHGKKDLVRDRCIHVVKVCK